MLPTSTSRYFSIMGGHEVTDDDLGSCAKLFDLNYGVWGERAPEISKSLKPGARVRMSSQKLKKQCLSDPEHTILALCKTPNHEVIGHAFATYWNYGPGEVCWITQLVVSAAHRRKGIASMLLRFIRDQRTFHAMGLVSSHPAACIALSELGGSRWIKAIDMAFIGDNATAILATSPIEYLRTARLVGSAFNPTSTTTAISSVYTNFFVDHVEPLEALTEFLAKAGQEAWPLGELLDGHEFLIIVRR